VECRNPVSGTRWKRVQQKCCLSSNLSSTALEALGIGRPSPFEAGHAATRCRFNSGCLCCYLFPLGRAPIGEGHPFEAGRRESAWGFESLLFRFAQVDQRQESFRSDRKTCEFKSHPGYFALVAQLAGGTSLRWMAVWVRIPPRVSSARG
jgi:hypothetical protein